MKNPDLRTALACAQQVIANGCSFTDVEATACRSLIVEMYDLDYTGVPEIIDKVLAEDLDAGQAVKAITALKSMYNSTGNG